MANDAKTPALVVFCRNCGSGIAVNNVHEIKDDFAVRCEKCARRSHYMKADLKRGDTR